MRLAFVYAVSRAARPSPPPLWGGRFAGSTSTRRSVPPGAPRSVRGPFASRPRGLAECSLTLAECADPTGWARPPMTATMGPVTELAERLLNLAMYLARNPQGVTAEDCRDEVEGYAGAAAQNDAAFKRMLERDKETLRASGLVIESRA